MAKGEGLKKAFTDLYNEFGRPLVNRIMNELGADATPQQVRRAAKRTAPSLSAKPKKPLAVQKALPAPPKPLALPAPGPGLPSFAAKPRGGQFYPDAELGPVDAQAAGYKLDNYTDRNGVDRYQVLRPDGTPVSGYAASSPELGWEYANAHFQNDRPFSNFSPENAARMARENYGLIQYNVVGDPEPQAQFGDWLERALAKYYKTEFGSPNDPLRSLAERGLHYDPQMTPELWQREVNDSLMKGPIGYFTVPRHEDEIKSNLLGGFDISNGFALHDPVGQGALMQAAPWLRKQPVTDMLYGIRGALDLGHFTDEMQNALRATEAGLPMDLAVRPESLDRMTFAQAAEHVGKINQFRAKQMEQAALRAMDSPVVHLFKDYPENNPKGLRWVEMAPPKGDAPTNYDPEAELAAALKYEGDTMGHCVGGYCPDVMSGRSRIFSLRDAKGEPHVTIETGKGYIDQPHRLVPDEVQQQIDAELMASGTLNYGRDYERALRDWVAKNVELPENIIQIKGKQNRSPKDDYLPFVQDFVKSQQWGNVGDLENTGLVRLPDGRYITRQQYDDVINSEGLNDAYQAYDYNAHGFPQDPSRITPDDWDYFSRHFEGFAIGGRVDADRCFCHNPLSVKKGR